MERVLIDFLHFGGWLQTIFLAAYFWNRRAGAGFGDFARLFLLLSAMLAMGWLYHTGRILYVPHLARAGLPLGACVGPLFFFALRSHLGGFSFTWRDACVFLVPAGIVLYLLPFYTGTSLEEKIAYVREDLKRVHFDCLVISFFTHANNLTFFALAARFVRGLRTARPEEPRRAYLAFHFRVALLGCALEAIALLWGVLDPEILNEGALTGLLGVGILLFAYTLLYKNREEPSRGYLRSRTKYEKSLLDDEFLDRAAAKIRSYFEDGRTFLEGGLRLDDLARALDLSPNQVSQVLSRRLDIRFSDLVNQHRVRHACEKLRDPVCAEMSILRIAFECGFDSKSAFNLAFRKHAGTTPSRWRQGAAQARRSSP